MKIDDCYKILRLENSATREEVEIRYENMCKLFYHTNASLEDLERFAKIKQAYYIVIQHLDDLEKSKEDFNRFNLKREPVMGKLKEALHLHGMKMFTLGTLAVGILISASAIKDIVDFMGSQDFDDDVVTEYTLDNNEVIGTIVEQLDEGTFVPPISQYLKDPVVSPEIIETIEESNLERTKNGNIIEVIDGVTYIDGHMIVNKTYSLPSDFVPTDPYKSITRNSGGEFLDRETVEAFNRMQSDASLVGINLWIASGYRSYDYQVNLYNKYVRGSGVNAADMYSARPGHSEHQTGLAFDINSVRQSFANTKEGIWIDKNCYKYGFVIRYPKGKSAETGYIYEPWHLRYVGIELARELYNGGDWITMEKYFGITSQYGVVEEKSKTF